MMPEQTFELACQLSPTEQRWLSVQVQAHIAATLPEHATLSKAAELYLADCSADEMDDLADRLERRGVL